MPEARHDSSFQYHPPFKKGQTSKITQAFNGSFSYKNGCEWDWEDLPRPDMPLTVGLDGGYVHSCTQRSRKQGWFEVIAGKSVTDDGCSKRFAFVHNYRYGETISTAFAESTVNQVVSKRMVKKQQMRWSQKGAHLMLQVRTRVLNGELRNEFRKWYPSFDHGSEGLPLAA